MIAPHESRIRISAKTFSIRGILLPESFFTNDFSRYQKILDIAGEEIEVINSPAIPNPNRADVDHDIDEMGEDEQVEYFESKFGDHPAISLKIHSFHWIDNDEVSLGFRSN